MLYLSNDALLIITLFYFLFMTIFCIINSLRLISLALIFFKSICTLWWFHMNVNNAPFLAFGPFWELHFAHGCNVQTNSTASLTISACVTCMMKNSEKSVEMINLF